MQLKIDQLSQQFQQISSSHFTGELLVASGSDLGGRTTSKHSWSLFFLLGRLLWVSSNLHRFRRWRRAIALFCSTINPDTLKAPGQDSPFWEYTIIQTLVKRQLLSRDRAVALVEYLACDVLFDIVREGSTFQMSSDHRIKLLGEPISILNAEQLLKKSQQRWQAWRDAESASFSPHFSPYIDNQRELQQNTSPKLYQTLTTLIDGKSTLADIAIAIKQDPLKLTQSLAPYFRKGLIHLRQVPDLPIRNSPDKPLAIAPLSHKPKVLCIDDSPSVCRQLETVLSHIGYQCKSIQDPLTAIPTVLELQPDLIFLDLVMPIVSGYEICAQIRRISAFKDTPIIILTGNDGLVDRVRAKVVGASEFIAKPVNPQKLMEVAQRYLPNSTLERSPSSQPNSYSQPSVVKRFQPEPLG